MTQSSSTRRKPAEQQEQQDKPAEQPSILAKLSVEQRLENLENCIAKIATLTGNGNHLKEFGLTRWTPEMKDMQKYRGE
jgi:hypothetical protein